MTARDCPGELEGHRVSPARVRNDELVLPVRRRRDRTLRSGRVVLSDFRAGGVVSKKVHVDILRAVRVASNSSPP